MKETKPEKTQQKDSGLSKIQMMKVTKDGTTFEVEAPYCTAEEWSRRTKIPVEEVKKSLYDRRIACYQPVAKGRLYVNVIAETKRLMEMREWN